MKNQIDPHAKNPTVKYCANFRAGFPGCLIDRSRIWLIDAIEKSQVKRPSRLSEIAGRPLPKTTAIWTFPCMEKYPMCVCVWVWAHPHPHTHRRERLIKMGGECQIQCDEKFFFKLHTKKLHFMKLALQTRFLAALFQPGNWFWGKLYEQHFWGLQLLSHTDRQEQSKSAASASASLSIPFPFRAIPCRYLVSLKPRVNIEMECSGIVGEVFICIWENTDWFARSNITLGLGRHEISGEDFFFSWICYCIYLLIKYFSNRKYSFCIPLVYWNI